MIAESEATGRTADLYQQVEDSLGIPFVPDTFRITSSRPELLAAIIAGFTAALFNFITRLVDGVGQ